MESNQPLDSNIHGDLNLSTDNRFDLREAATWAKFLAIVGFIFIGLGVIGVFSFGALMASSPVSGMEGMSGMYSMIMILYILILLIYFLPILYLFRFATKIKTAVNTNNQGDMNTAFANLKAHYKFLGILTAVILGLYFIGILFTVSMGMGSF